MAQSTTERIATLESIKDELSHNLEDIKFQVSKAEECLDEVQSLINDLSIELVE